jgi:fluoroacetyl-CoA thioesterase
MKASMRAGLEHELVYRVAPDKTVPNVYAEAELFRTMPPVFATAYLVGLIEWACMQAMAPHLEEGEQSVGTAINTSHTAATPPGFDVRVAVVLERVEGRRLSFSFKASDNADAIAEGTHERFVIDRARFLQRVAEKVSAGIRQT